MVSSGVSLHDLHAVRHAAALQEFARLGGALGIAFQGHDPSLAQLLADVERGVADGGAHLQHAGIESAGQGGQQAAGLPGNDRHAVAVGHRLHLGHHLGPRGADFLQVAVDGVVEDRHGARLDGRFRWKVR